MCLFRGLKSGSAVQQEALLLPGVWVFLSLIRSRWFFEPGMYEEAANNCRSITLDDKLGLSHALPPRN